MKTRGIPIIAGLIALCCTLSAETFVLKDGSRIEGTILREDAESYVVEVQVTRTIKDERTIPKADVVKIERARPDLRAFEEIEKLMPTPDFMSQEDYAARIRQVEAFLTEHRGTEKAPDARKILDQLKSEGNEIVAGGIKMGGKMISAAEYRANAYEIDARVMQTRITERINRGDHLAALRLFSEMDRDFANTAPYQEVLPLVIRAINAHLAATNQALAGYDARMNERRIGLDRMAQADRMVTEAAIAEEAARFDRRLAAEKEARIGWVTTDPYHKASLDETLNFGRQELTRVSAQAGNLRVDAGKLYRDALRMIQGRGEAAEINAAISALRSAQVPAKYMAVVEAAAAVK